MRTFKITTTDFGKDIKIQGTHWATTTDGMLQVMTEGNKLVALFKNWNSIAVIQLAEPISK